MSTGKFTYEEAKETPNPYRFETAELQAAGFDDVFGLYPLNVSVIRSPSMITSLFHYIPQDAR